MLSLKKLADHTCVWCNLRRQVLCDTPLLCINRLIHLFNFLVIKYAFKRDFGREAAATVVVAAAIALALLRQPLIALFPVSLRNIQRILYSNSTRQQLGKDLVVTVGLPVPDPF